MHVTHTAQQHHPSLLRVVQITDTHLFSSTRDALLGVNTEDSFQEVLEKCLSEHDDTDFFLVTGDIAQQQDKHIYERFFKRMNETGKPYFCIAGNHDANAHLSSDSYPVDYADNQVIETKDWRFILLNSSFNEQPSGKLEQADLDWLAGLLNQQDDEKHTMIVLHHHPIPMQSAWIDQHMLQDADAFWDVLTGHDHVKVICFGHVHQDVDETHHDIRVLATPSTSIQFKPKCDDFTVDALPAGFRWFELAADGGIKTAVKRLDKVPDTIDLTSEGY